MNNTTNSTEIDVIIPYSWLNPWKTDDTAKPRQYIMLPDIYWPDEEDIYDENSGEPL